MIIVVALKGENGNLVALSPLPWISPEEYLHNFSDPWLYFVDLVLAHPGE